MFKWLTRGSVRLVERYLPDPYIFVLWLTAIAALSAWLVEGTPPLALLRMWGDGFWGLLTFAMQMVLVLITGHMLASTPLMKRALDRLASTVHSAGGAILLVTLVSLTASWLNWGFGLVVGALFAKALARRVQVDYRLLVASAYSGFLVWHGGLAGSVPLTIATPGHFHAQSMGVVPTSATIFAAFNLWIVVALFIAVPLVNRWMLPAPSESVYVDPARLGEGQSAAPPTAGGTPAERWENGRVLTALAALAGLAWLLDHFVVRGAGLNLNVVNFLFLFGAICLHRTPRRLLDSLTEAIRGAGGIVLQFPFYAGIMAIMVESGLAASLSAWMASFASAASLPVWTFLSAGLVNIFVPSGGGQWAVQSPIVIQAAQALDADLARSAMAVAWGDAWTNMLQPFWALPMLAIAGLRARDIMGYCLIQLVVAGVLIAIGLRYF